MQMLWGRQTTGERGGSRGTREGATAIVQAGNEGGPREVDGFKRTLGAQTGSLADGLDAWGEGAGRASVSAQPVIPGLVPGTQSWPPHGSCSEEEFSWGRPRNSYRVTGETRLSCPRTSHLTPFRSLPQCHLFREASLTTLSQRAPPTISFFPSLVCFMCLIILLHVSFFAVWLPSPLNHQPHEEDFV